MSSDDGVIADLRQIGIPQHAPDVSMSADFILRSVASKHQLLQIRKHLQRLSQRQRLKHQALQIE